jgi:uncharacterized protein (TIGR04255 family)
MSDKLANAPIFYTTAQVRFNPVLDMAEFVERLQKKWRLAYPDFSLQPLNQLQFHLPAPGQQPDFKVNSTPRWHFKNTEQVSGIILTTDSIIYHTTAYSTSEEFFSPLLEALSVVHETVSLSYIESVAMRTLDAIIPDEGHPLSFYLNENLLGLSAQLEGTLKHSLYELVLIRPEDQLTTRIAFLSGKVGIPADLVPIALVLPARLLNLNRPHAILDNDCIQKRRFQIDIAKAGEALKAVKKRVTDAFNTSVTKQGMDYWRSN